MKYTELLQIADFLRDCAKIHSITRVDDNALCVNFDKISLIFDMNRAKSAIYAPNGAQNHKSYAAPFDIALKKFFHSASIREISVLENNRILLIKTRLDKSYKAFESSIFFEFTGKNTNVIITDEKKTILAALRHFDNGIRPIKVGLCLKNLPPFAINERFEPIENFQVYFQNAFEKTNQARLNALKTAKISGLNKRIEKLEQTLNALENESDLAQKAQNLSHKAQIITANLYALKDFERKISLDDFNGKKLEFIIDKAPKIWANEAFKAAKKLKQKATNLYIQKENLSQKIDTQKELITLIKASNSAFECEILAPKKSANERQKKEQSAQIASFDYDGVKIYVGKNAKENEFLLKFAKKNDMWFHIKDYAGAHAIVRTNKQNLNQNLLEFVGKLCVHFSKLNKGAYLVDYTRRENVAPKGGALVEYKCFKSIRITKE